MSLTNKLFAAKVRVIGRRGVGKSCLIKRYVERKFTQSHLEGNQYKEVNIRGVDGVFDVSEEADVSLSHIQQDTAILITYDTANMRSFDDAKHSLHEVTRYKDMTWDKEFSSSPFSASYTYGCVVALVGTKADLSNKRKVKYADAQACAKQNRVLFMEVSAKTGWNVDNLFSKIGLMLVSRVMWQKWTSNITLQRYRIVDEIDLYDRRWIAGVLEIDLSYSWPSLWTDLRLWRLDSGHLRFLCKLNLSHSRCAVLPDAKGFLYYLTHLYLSDNCLSSLPASLEDLKNLRELDLRNNEFREISIDVTNLRSLKTLRLEGNPLTPDSIIKLLDLRDEKKGFLAVVTVETPAEILVQGQLATRVYQTALRDGYVNVYRGRIFLIGQDRSGKTSLKKSLLGLPFDPNEESTEGIDPSKCEIDVDRVQNWHVDRKRTILSEVSGKISRFLATELYGLVRPELNKKNLSLELEATLSREGSAAQEMAFSDVDAFLNEAATSADGPKETKKQSPTEQVRRADSLVNDDNASSEVELPIHGQRQGRSAIRKSGLPLASTVPPDEVTRHATQYLKEFLRGEETIEDVGKEDPIVTLDVWDFAGQHLYYATHPVFFSPRGVYVLVHNLSKALDAAAEPCVRQGVHDIFLANPNGETNMENLLSWLVTVHRSRSTAGELGDNSGRQEMRYLRPPVIIVGTHADKPFEDINAMTSQIQRKISGKEYEKHVIRPLFSIDNTQSSKSLFTRTKRFFEQASKKGPQTEPDDDTTETSCEGIDALRAKIMDVLREEPYMGEKIPIRWAHFEKVIEDLVAQSTHYTSVEELQTSAREVCFIDNEREFQVMLNFYHDLGLIIRHRSTVILESEWLIDLFGQLITIPRFDKAEPLHSSYWRELERSGCLCMDIVDDVFSKFIKESVAKEDILDMMDQFGLIAKFTSTASGTKYFVPAQLKTPPMKVCNVEPSHSDPCALYLHFGDGFVPHGLFTQLVSRSISWYCKTWRETSLPILYLNGAKFVIVGEQLIYNFVLLCQKSFIKIVLKQRHQDDESVPVPESAEIPSRVRVFVEDTLQRLSHELPCLIGLQYELSVACPDCLAECLNHKQVCCTQEDCVHFLKLEEGQRLFCTKGVRNSVRKVPGVEKWFSLRRTQELYTHRLVGRPNDTAVQTGPRMSAKVVNITLLASEWGSSMGGLSTINRTLAIVLAKHSLVNITLLVPESTCSEEDKRTAAKQNITIWEAQCRPGYDPLDWLSFPSRDLAIDIVVGHGAKLGKQAQVIRESHGCKWVQVVHTAPEELGMFKDYHIAVATGEEKNRAEVDLCRLANLVVAVGPKLTKAYTSYLRFCKKHQDIIQLTPGTFNEFTTVEQAVQEEERFKVLTFGRGDSEDFILKGYDIAAKALVELQDSSYCLLFAGAPIGEQDKVAKKFLQTGITKDQLIVRAFVQSREGLKELFCEADLAIMPSRTEGFGLTALEALSAGLPILVSGNSGFAHALRDLPSGKSFVVNSNDPKEWADAIASIRQKERAQRLQDIQALRASYEERYSWADQCGALVEKIWNMAQEG